MMTPEARIRVDRRVAEAKVLLSRGQPDEALALLRAAPPSEAVTTGPLEAQALKDLGRLDQALTLRIAETRRLPVSAVAEHNLAALLGDMNRAPEAEAAVRRAMAKGGDAPETWLVLARALQAMERYDESEAAFRQALMRRPDYAEAVRDLCQLIWMRSGDLTAARVPVETALALAPHSAALHVVKAVLREFMGEPPQAIWRDLTAHAPVSDPGVQLNASNLALAFDRDRALHHAQAAVALIPEDTETGLALAQAYLARGETDLAMGRISRVLAVVPDHQFALALCGTAARMQNRVDPLNDLDSLVRGYVIDTPQGWPDLSTYLADLAQALGRLHGLQTHPVGQSLRHGTQTAADLSASDDPAIRAFFHAVEGPIRAHLRHLGRGDDPVRRRNTGDYRLSGCWSVRLAPGGHHTPHVHPRGWLSSACHIDLPPAVAEAGHEGWLAFGQPPFACDPSLQAARHDKPVPGRLVLFPSCLWHGTVPFSGSGTRLTIAFDVVPV